MDYSYLLGARPVTVPGPMDFAQQALTLGQLADSATIHRLAAQQQQMSMDAQNALNRVLPAVHASGFTPEAVQRAIQQEPLSAGPLLKALDERRKADADYANVNAQAAERTSVANKNKLQPLTNMAYSLATKPDLSPDDIKQFSGLVAQNGLQNLVPNIRFQDWVDPATGRVTPAARAGMKTIGSAFFEAEKQVAAAQNAAKNADDSARGWYTAQSEAERRKQQTAIDWANAGVSGIGAPQEVTINGKPGLAVFNKKTGGFYDPMTMQPITGTVTPKITDSAQDKLNQNNLLLAKIDDAMKMVNARPQSFGLKMIVSDKLNSRMDPQGVPNRAAVASISSQKFHDLSGAAITISEAPRLQPFIPTVDDEPRTVTAKLRGLQREAQIMQRELLGGHSLGDVVNAPPTSAPTKSAGGEIGGDITITPIGR